MGNSRWKGRQRFSVARLQGSVQPPQKAAENPERSPESPRWSQAGHTAPGLLAPRLRPDSCLVQPTVCGVCHSSSLRGPGWKMRSWQESVPSGSTTRRKRKGPLGQTQAGVSKEGGARSRQQSMGMPGMDIAGSNCLSKGGCGARPCDFWKYSPCQPGHHQQGHQSKRQPKQHPRNGGGGAWGLSSLGPDPPLGPARASAGQELLLGHGLGLRSSCLGSQVPAGNNT